MQKKDISVVLEGEPPIIIRGGETPMVDDRWLVIMDGEGSYIQFNVEKVLYFGVSDHDEETCGAH